MRSLPWQNCKNWTPFCSGEKIFNFSTRDPDHLHALASRAYGAIFSKNRFFGTTHGDKPTSQNGISLRSPSLIMAPAFTQHHAVGYASQLQKKKKLNGIPTFDLLAQSFRYSLSTGTERPWQVTLGLIAQWVDQMQSYELEFRSSLNKGQWRS